MNKTFISVVAVVSLLMISPLLNNNMIYGTGSGLKVNLNAISPMDGNGQYCVHGGGETICRSAEVPGEVQVQFGKGVVGEGDSIRGCVEFRGQTECDSGTNTSCKCPENLQVSFGSGSNNNDQSSSAASSSSSSSSSASASSSLCLAFCNSPNSDPVIERNSNDN